MIDLHSHILPGIDDGARDWDEALRMAREAVTNGVNKIIATPHHKNGVYINESVAVISLVNKLNQLLMEENIPLSVYPGSETQIYGDFIKELKEKQFLTLNNTKKYVLLELPFSDVPRYTEQLIFDIQMAGLIPIIAHPERNQEIRENPIKIYQLVTRGALTQITTSSLLGSFGKDIQKFAFEMVDNNLAHLIATDAHRPTGSRGFNLSDGYYQLNIFGGTALEQQFKTNAKNVFEGRDLYVDIPTKIVKKKRRFGII